MNKVGNYIFAIALVLMSARSASAEESVAAGKLIFSQCALCHSVEPGVKKIGPSLHGIVNRPIASVAGFNYSADMIALKKNWDMETLDAFLADPRALVPGTFMAIGGIKKVQDRQALLAYLATLH